MWTTYLRSVWIEEVESGSVRVLHKKIVHFRRRRRSSIRFSSVLAIQCHWLFVDNMDDHVRRMSHWCVWSSVLCRGTSTRLRRVSSFVSPVFVLAKTANEKIFLINRPSRQRWSIVHLQFIDQIETNRRWTFFPQRLVNVWISHLISSSFVFFFIRTMNRIRTIDKQRDKIYQLKFSFVCFRRFLSIENHSTS